MFRFFLAAVALFGLVALNPALAADSVTLRRSLTITRLWTNATPPGAPTATGYVTVTNSGTTADRLVGVSSSVAGPGMLHQMTFSNGIASMRMVDGIDIPPGKTVTLDPNGFHMMFDTLTAPLKTGDQLPVTLTFQKAGKVDAVLQIMPIGSRGPAS